MMDGPVFLKVKKTKGPLLGLRYQPIPIHDYMNFKEMTSNEILLNLDNVENLAPSELVGGLVELSKRDKNQEHDWNQHPISAKCLQELKEMTPRLSPKHVA